MAKRDLSPNWFTLLRMLSAIQDTGTRQVFHNISICPGICPERAYLERGYIFLYFPEQMASWFHFFAIFFSVEIGTLPFAHRPSPGPGVADKWWVSPPPPLGVVGDQTNLLTQWSTKQIY